jgi:putative ABC transport system substrate-binding protein
MPCWPCRPCVPHRRGLAQAPKAGPPKRLGVLNPGRDSDVPRAQRPFYVALREKGWILGDNLAVETTHADFKVDRLPELAEQLVSKRVDLVICEGDLAAVAAARATRAIPIFFCNVVYPVDLGLVDSFARPGRNATGRSFAPEQGTLDLIAKRFTLLREVVPNAKRLAWVGGGRSAALPTVTGGRLEVAAQVEAAAAALGFEIAFHPWPARQDYDAVFAGVVASRAQAVATVVVGWPYVERQRLAEFLLRDRIPSVHPWREMVESGGVLSYGADFADLAYAEGCTVEFADRLLRGTPPAELPVEGPRQYLLAINLKTANALGLTIAP